MAEIKNILFVTGRDYQGAFTLEDEIFDKINSRFSVTTIGNQTDGCKLTDIMSEVAGQATEGRCLVLLRAHGSVGEIEHHIRLSSDERPSTEAVFKAIAEASDGRPVDVFMRSCGSNYAQIYADLLPIGSTLTTCSPTYTYGNSVEKILASYPSILEFNAENILLSYLTHSEEVYWDKNADNAPIFCVSGGMTSDLAFNLENPPQRQSALSAFASGAQALTGGRIPLVMNSKNNRQTSKTNFSPEEIVRIHTKLDPIVGADRVNRLIRDVSQLGDPAFANDPIKRGAMALVFAASPETNRQDFCPLVPVRTTSMDRPTNFRSTCNINSLHTH